MPAARRCVLATERVSARAGARQAACAVAESRITPRLRSRRFGAGATSSTDAGDTSARSAKPGRDRQRRFVVGDRCVAVMRHRRLARSRARQLRAAGAGGTDRPVCAVDHTHMHPDHGVGGTSALRPMIAFHRPGNLGPALAARAPAYDASALRRAHRRAGGRFTSGMPTRLVAPGQPFFSGPGRADP